jgi:hypothetical protein
VTFLVREGKTAGGQREQVPVTLAIGEFTRKWCLHIQPDQLTKTRYFGGWSNGRCAAYMARCREMIQAIAPPASPELAVEFEQAESLQCPHCGSERLELIETTGRPSWKELFWRESETCPWWYADRQREDHRRFWTEANGEDYYDWYLETWVEGAKEPASQPSPEIQLHLVGMTPQVSFEIESF